MYITVFSHCKVHETSTFTPLALCYHSVAYMYPWKCLIEDFYTQYLAYVPFCCSVETIISAYFK